jgi:polysaccharide biosynthesis protein PelA
LPQVEVASHTYTHPYRWSFFEAYERNQELAWVDRLVSAVPGSADRILSDTLTRWRQSRGSAAAGAFEPMPGMPPLPRARPHIGFSLDFEVRGALLASSTQALAGKPARMYLWSGDTRPFEGAIRATRELGVKNMNGGDSRFDTLYPSAAYVAPLARQVGAERQINAVNSNENTYINGLVGGLAGPFDAFKALSETLDNTETPRRLKGFNLYYHTFSAARQASLDVVVTHLERARSAPVTPITASQYAGIAEGFFSARITSLGAQRFQISDRGELGTVRFDDATSLDIDYAASQGVVGHTRHMGALYASLDPATVAPIIALRAKGADQAKLPGTRANRLTFNTPHLVDARWLVSSIARTPCVVTGTVQGFGNGQMTWDGLAPGAYVATLTRNRQTIAQTTVTADSLGRAVFTLQATVIEPADLRLACASLPVRKVSTGRRQLTR